MKPVVVSVPISVQVSKKKRFYLNLNQYRNAHFRTLDKAKKVFLEEVSPIVEPLPFFEQIALTFTLYPGKGIIPDTSNVCCIVEKFFNDALVDLGKIQDDNHKIVLGSQYLFGEKDITNPRVEVKIHPHRNHKR